jgi:FkbM family methyltransferase
MSISRYAFPAISVAGRPAVSLCVDLDAGDEVAPWLLEHDWIDEPVQRAFLDWVQPGGRVIDLGSHLGVFSLPAAALGAEVLAIDASPRHVTQVSLAAARNGFGDRYHAVWGACTDADHPVAFFEDSIHGHVLTEEDSHELGRRLDVPSRRVDDLLDELGWEHVDVVKLDIEGGELAALRGMSRLFARGCRPVLVFECNGMMLPLYGGSTYALREAICQLGYELMAIDHLRPGLLVTATAESVQPEAVTDYLALRSADTELPVTWSLQPGFGVDTLAARLCDQAVNEIGTFRAYVAALVHDAPVWLREHPLLQVLAETLRRDVDPTVRGAATHGARPRTAVGDAGPPAGPAELPPEVRVWCAEVGFRAPVPGLEHPLQLAAVPQFRTSFSASAGQYIGLLGEPDLTLPLLGGLAGELPASAGAYHVSGSTLDLTMVGRIGEPELSGAENVLAIAAQLGGDLASVDVEGLCAAVGLDGTDPAPLRAHGLGAVASLAVLVALALPAVEVLLIGELPPRDEQIAAHIRERLLAWCREDGCTVIQAISVPERALGPVDRLVWLTPAGPTLAGHPESVADAFWRTRLGLPAAKPGLELERPLGRTG